MTQEEVKRLNTYLADKENVMFVPGKRAFGSSVRKDEKRRSLHTSMSQRVKEVIKISLQDRNQIRKILKKKCPEKGAHFSFC